MTVQNDDILYPIGVQTFPKLRMGGFFYVDKTNLIWEIVKSGGYYFLSRPRRFGKSLLLSTIEAYYQGRRELFKGLAIDRLSDDWEPHPILHLDLNTDKYDSGDSLDIMLNSQLSKWERKFGVEVTPNSPLSYRFGEVIAAAYRKTGKKVVILVDEYDKPMLNAINDEKLADSYRSTLKAFYGNLKSCDRYIEFAMLTGVARFSKISIFSDLNNLRDLTFENNFSAICGITSTELNSQFQDGIAKLATNNGLTVEETMSRLKTDYDGYHFSRKSEDIYNPFALMNVFGTKEFGSYWSDSGTPTYLVRLLENTPMELRDISGYQTDIRSLANGGIMTGDPIVALYQTGYLSIKEYEPEFDLVTLDYPNREVKESFIKFLVPYYTSLRDTETAFTISHFTKEVRDGNPKGFMDRLSTLVSRIPYGGKGSTPEDHFQNAVYLIFTLMGFSSHVEDRTSNGRIDLVVETPKYVYLFEFKTGKTAREAMNQIEAHGYWKGYLSSSKKIFLVAANFNPVSKQIDDVLIDER